ncbi:hypothetical protein [Halomicrobium katesii]|uniref:hypothetical protein n=1 Tax=Halomicrobium katesii TaxID=437163 RepID=UPI000475DB5E|nr:hypothetical protein [Halomicrobium katesii]
MSPRPRRAVLLGLGVALSTVAGCRERESTPTQTSDRGPETTGRSGDTQTDAGDETTRQPTVAEGDETARRADETETAELDLREANVVDVALQSAGGRAVEFSVTLYHDDDGEDGYADWWQVETLAGDRLGRRELLHAHSTAPFTRSETIEVPESVHCVVVRGHDQRHGYGGQAMVVDVDTGQARRVRQGGDSESVDGGDCP